MVANQWHLDGDPAFRLQLIQSTTIADHAFNQYIITVIISYNIKVPHVLINITVLPQTKSWRLSTTCHQDPNMHFYKQKRRKKKKRKVKLTREKEE